MFQGAECPGHGRVSSGNAYNFPKNNNQLKSFPLQLFLFFMYTFNNFTYTFVVEYENEIFLYISRQYLGIFSWSQLF